jgi:hypothetical protein
MRKRWKSSWCYSVCSFAVLMVTGLLAPGNAHAQTNSWAYPSGGYWDDFRNWSLGVPPASSQVVFITNAPTKLVTIDSYTSGVYPDSMTITSLTLSADEGLTNTLFLSNAGTSTPLYVQDSLMIVSGGVLLMTNSSLRVGGPDDGSFVLEGTAEISGTNTLSGDVYIGFSTNSTGSAWLLTGQSVLSNGYTVIGFYGSGVAIVSNASLQAASSNPVPSAVFAGLTTGSQGALSIAGGSYIAPEHLSLGEESGSTGLVWVSGGQLILTNDFLTSIGGNGVGQMIVSAGQVLASVGSVASGPGSQGTLTISGGSVTFKLALCVGGGIRATGAVSITGGQLTVTNQDTLLGSYGVGQMTVSNGTLLARTIYIGNSSGSVAGNSSGSQGMLTIAGGATVAASKIVAGVYSNSHPSSVSNQCCGAGIIQVTGGGLSVTSQTGTGQLVIGQDGQGTFTQSGGAATVDQLLVINGTNSTFNFSAGVFNTKATTVSNSQTFVVGDGVGAATYHLLGGIHSFANALRIRNNAVLSGCGTIIGNVLVDAGGTVLADCGGTLTFSGIVTNNGYSKAVNGSVLESYGPVVNNGVIDVIDGHTNFLAGFVNNGVVLTADNVPRIVSISLVGLDVGIDFTTVSNFTQVVEFTSNLVSQSWMPLSSLIGSGGLTNVVDSGAAVLPQRFYRIRLVVPP